MRLVVKKLIEMTVEYLSDPRIAALLADPFRFRERPDLISASFRGGRSRPPARKRGRPPQQRERHMRIAGAVAMLVEDAGLNPTRSHASRRQGEPSACSIVTTALDQLGEHLSERTVEGIWNENRLWSLIIHRIIRDDIPTPRPQ